MTTNELGSWSDTPTRAAIVDFVARVTAETAAEHGWTVVSIKNDWTTVFA